MLLCSDQVVASLRAWHLEGLKPKAKFWTFLCGLRTLQGLGFPVGAPKLVSLENAAPPLVSSRFCAGHAGSKAASGALGWSELLGRARARFPIVRNKVIGLQRNCLLTGMVDFGNW